MEGEQNTQGTSQAPQTPPNAPQGDNTLLMGILAYISVLVLIPLLTAKDNPGVQFHVRQGLVLLIIEVIIMLAGGILFIPYTLMRLLDLVMIAFSIIGIVNVVQKKQADLPLVGQFAKHMNV